MKFAPLTLERYQAVVGESPKVTMRGFSLVDGEKPLMVVGIYPDDDRHVLFSQVAPEFRGRFDSFEAKRLIVRAARKAMEMVHEAGGVIHASADAKYPNTSGFLERLGFRHLGRSVYEFRGLTMREKVLLAEREMRAHGTPVEIPVTHHFANRGTEDGAYAREIAIPKWSMVTGKIHKTEQINVLLEGVIHVSTENGIERMVGPRVLVSPAGTKRIAITETDVRWLTFHATRETDLEKIEEHFIAQTEQEYLDFMRCLELKAAA